MRPVLHPCVLESPLNLKRSLLEIVADLAIHIVITALQLDRGDLVVWTSDTCDRAKHLVKEFFYLFFLSSWGLVQFGFDVDAG